MNAKLRGISKSHAAKFYAALREHLTQRADGQEAIAAFEENLWKEGVGSDALADHIKEQLSIDNTLINSLEESLGKGNQITTIVAGGYVDEIINIAQLGALNLHLTTKKYLIFFRDVRQLVTFLLFAVLVVSGIGYGIWSLNQPIAMDKEFNIAVAEFQEIPDSGKPAIAPIVSQQIFSFLNREYQLTGFEVEVTHDKIGVLKGGAEAEKLAKKTNADIVVFGTITIIKDLMIISPEFYFAESLRADAGELTGQNHLPPVELAVEDIGNIGKINSPENIELRDRTRILVEFTKGLTFLASNAKSESNSDLRQALAATQNAIRQAEAYGDLEGVEVLYLFGSHVARLLGAYDTSQTYIDQAFAANPNYGRAFIAQANIFYDQLEFDQALPLYEAALELNDQPYGYHLFEKTHLGIGNINNYWFQTASEEEKPALAKESLSHFQFVIDSYESTENTQLREMAALAYYGSGIIFQIQMDADKAIDTYTQAINLTESESLRNLAQNRMEHIAK